MKGLSYLLAVAGITSVSSASGLDDPRSSIDFYPYAPRLAINSPPVRTKTCHVKSRNDSVTDDSCRILTALHKCNHGGRVVFERDTTYVINKALDLTFLNHIDLDIQGTLLFGNDTDYWQSHGFPYVFQDVISFFRLGGEDVMIYGGGTIDGNGQAWYDLFAKNTSTLRPVLCGFDGLKDAILSDLNLQYSPQYYHFIANSSNIVFNKINISGHSKNNNKARNTDGWDIYRSNGITIMNSTIDNGDDCVSLKPNSTDVLVQNLHCTGSHGISVGSLGQYAGQFDIVENLMVSNVTMIDTFAGARIKVWPDLVPGDSGDYGTGGGGGHVRNCTWEDIYVTEADWGVEINGCYNQGNLTECLEYPSLVTMDDLHFRRFAGMTNDEHDPEVAVIGCSAKDACHNISSSDIKVVSPSGGIEGFCLNVDWSQFDFKCTDNYTGL